MSNAERSPVRVHLALILVALGLVLIAASFAPFSFLSKRAWTIEDSDAFAQVTRDLHASTLAPQRSPESADLYRQELERKYEGLSAKLAHAQDEPRRWSLWLLCSGVAIATAGAVVHATRHVD